MSNLTGVIIKHPDNGIKSHVEQCDTISSLEIINSDLFNSQSSMEIRNYQSLKKINDTSFNYFTLHPSGQAD